MNRKSTQVLNKWEEAKGGGSAVCGWWFESNWREAVEPGEAKQGLRLGLGRKAGVVRLRLTLAGNKSVLGSGFTAT